jgi:hypothetical protein
MSGRNFGPAVSGYLDPTGRAWETVVFQAGKPVLDKELNLEQGIDGGQAENDLRRAMPSGWISDDFLIAEDPTVGFFVQINESLTLQIVQGLVAHVNGWLLDIEYTNTTGTSNLGTAASITTVVSGTVTITGVANMTAASVGAYITISGAASPGNNGTFLITSFISSTSVAYANSAGVASDANNPNIHWLELLSLNVLPLAAGPSGNGSARTDLVILEVWRRLLSAAPSTLGKSASGRIWQNGNVKTDPANDLILNYSDDIKDSNVGAETTKRVQIQYRLRVIGTGTTGVNLFSSPYGMEDPNVIANTVPATASIPDGVPSSEAFTYTNQSANGDPGLWLAGDGNPANSLGTVDGYMYAIPLMGIFRRNTNAFARILNQNGGQSFPTSSDRPDGFWQDVVESQDIISLRQGVSPVGWDFEEVLNKNFNYLLDNQQYTDIFTNTFGGGNISGATVLWADEIGPFPSDGAGPLIGNFDACRRRFSDRSIIETVTIEIPAPGGAWTNGATFNIDPTSLNIYPYTGLNITVGVNIVLLDIQDAWWLGGSGHKTLNAVQYFQTVSGFGAVGPVTVAVTMGTLTGLGLTSESLFIDLVVAYPTDVGLSRTPTATFGANSFALTGGSVPSSSPYSFSAFANQAFDDAHREVQLEYTTSPLTITQAANTDSGSAASVTAFSTPLATITGLTGMYPELVGQQLSFSGAHSAGNNGLKTIAAFISPSSVQITNSTAVAPDTHNGSIAWTLVSTFFRLPERAETLVSVSKNGGPPTPATLDSTGRVVSLSSTTTTSGDHVTVVYTAIRPMPQNTAGNLEQMTIYYATRSAQAARQALLGTSLQVIPKAVAEDLYCITTGSGSHDDGYPWPQGYVQTGGIYPNSTNVYSGESDLSGRAAIAVTEFNASTGFLKLPIYVPMVAIPEQLTFTGVGTDIEGRSYFNAIPGGVYVPNAYAQDLSNSKRHKNVVPMLCELASDSPLGHRGQLVLVLLIRYALFDSSDYVAFESDETLNTTVASVFRIKGNLLNKRAI